MSELVTVPASAGPAVAAATTPAARPGSTPVGERGATGEEVGTELAAFAALLSAALSTRPAAAPEPAPGTLDGASSPTGAEGGAEEGAAPVAAATDTTPGLPATTPVLTGAVAVLASDGGARSAGGARGAAGSAVGPIATDTDVTTTPVLPSAAADEPMTEPRTVPAGRPTTAGAPATAANGAAAPPTPTAAPPIPTASAPAPDPSAPRPAADAASRDATSDVPVTGPSAPAPSAPVPSAATDGGPATAPAPGAASRELVGRVIDALDLLENAPPPRRMTIEVPDADGLRLHVSLRGSEVHVAVQGGGAGSPDLSGWGRELSAGLASRGFDLGGFSTDGRGEHGGDGAPRDDTDHPPTPGPDRRGRPTHTDTGLRL